MEKFATQLLHRAQLTSAVLGSDLTKLQATYPNAKVEQAGIVVLGASEATVVVFIGGASVGAQSFEKSQEDYTVIGNDINRIVGYNDQLHSAFESIKDNLTNANTKIANLTSNNRQLTAQLNQSNDELHALRLKADNQSLPHVLQNLPQPCEIPAKDDASSNAASSSSASN